MMNHQLSRIGAPNDNDTTRMFEPKNLRVDSSQAKACGKSFPEKVAAMPRKLKTYQTEVIEQRATAEKVRWEKHRLKLEGALSLTPGTD
jgi:hypothetical protein